MHGPVRYTPSPRIMFVVLHMLSCQGLSQQACTILHFLSRSAVVSRVAATRMQHTSFPFQKRLACWCRIYKPQAVVPENKQIVWGWDHGITVGALPVSMFANGHIFFTQRLYEVSTHHALDMGISVCWYVSLLHTRGVWGMHSRGEACLSMKKHKTLARKSLYREPFQRCWQSTWLLYQYFN